MNIKTLVLISVGTVIFLGIWLFSMVSALALLVGFGFGVWWHDWLNDIFKNYQKSIYLSEKSNIENKKRQLESELEKLKKETT